MHELGRGFKRAVAAPLAALMLMLSVSVPMLDASGFSTDKVAESQHEPGSCAPSHDHTICTQVGASHSLPQGGQLLAPEAPLGVPFVLGTRDPVVVSVLADGHPTRGPPSA